MKVLVIGGTGFIGPHAVKQLAAAGHEVTVLHRGDDPPWLDGVARSLRGDRDRIADSRAAIARLAPDAVVDVILYTEDQARTLIEALRGIAGRLVVLSSGDVYRNFGGLRGNAEAPPDPIPLGETAPVRERFFVYRGLEEFASFRFRDDYEKLLVERCVLGEAGLPGTVLRLPAVHGEGDRRRRLQPYLDRMDAGRPAILLEETEASFRLARGYVGNIGAAIAVAAVDARASGRIYNVAEPTAFAQDEWLSALGRAAGWEGRIVTMPAISLPAALRQPEDWRYDLAMDTSRIRKELGFVEPITPEEGLDRTIVWERSLPRTDRASEFAAEDAALAAWQARGQEQSRGASASDGA